MWTTDYLRSVDNVVVVRYIADRDISLVKFRYLGKDGYIHRATVVFKGKLDKRKALEELSKIFFI
ncbi:hypothetical protein Arcpr_0617 [Archaeoglobus profundus DSM 5631]|uniref:Uncharacterized protein n=1 Tax=Archaeoglobus profundus (strain DSM 5631 / JCM 9629 / NBRC 100127 / Av18) TaxID=572546 RepID=D2RHA7_ARCPA|nr:hypothetical protein Arcpr_0617 [Archaeoglobus profundus DSM 5631]